MRLVLTHEAGESAKALKQRLQATYQLHASKGCLRSGATITVGLRVIEETASALLCAWVDNVSKASKSVEAYAMISEALEMHLLHLRTEIDGPVELASGHRSGAEDFERLLKHALPSFDQSCAALRRQLQIHRFAFTKPDPNDLKPAMPLAVISPPLAAPPSPRANPGGRPAAYDWEEMWSAMAAALYVGDLQPKTQADIERAMMNWVITQGGEPNESTVRPKARRLWSKIDRA